jgi:hypothetical protein
VLELVRYRGIALVMGGILAAVVMVDAGLNATVGLTARWLPYHEYPTDTSVFDATGGKIVAAMASERVQGRDRPLGVLFGQSTVGAAVDPRIMEHDVQPPMRWANLHGWGGSLNRTLDLSDMTLLSGLKPSVVVLGINPYMLVGRDYGATVGLEKKSVKRAIKERSWTITNYILVNYLIRYNILWAKFWIFDHFGQGIGAMYRPDDGLSGIPPPALAQAGAGAAKAKERVVSDGEVKARLVENRALGWFEPERYTVNENNAHSLAKIVHDWRARGARVIIVLMPEHSLFRNQFPAEATRCFAAINDKFFHDDPVPVINLRDRIADQRFQDPDHVNITGRQEASHLVAARVSELLTSPSRVASKAR